jgi:Rps23 Pro-64 3,4-dihydroxylase Tpa1-like proline 4-hydroxylase
MHSKDELVNLIFSKLTNNKTSLTEQWQNPEGTKTPHFFIDDLLPIALCEQIYSSFPKNADGFYSLDSFKEKKRTSVNLDDYDPILQDITYAFQDKKIVDLIADIAGYTEIEPDPMLYAGGLSMMFKDDFLNPHLDNSHDGKRDRYRRLNLLYYVAPDWKLENGGNLELWDDARLHAKTILAKPNRLVVMATNKQSWHSVSPVKVAGPRCCVSNYYFSKNSPDDTEYFHVTSYTGRPEEKMRRAIGVLDNALRNIVSKTLKIGRGKSRNK